MILLNRECYLQMLAGILMGRQPSIPSLYTWVLDLSDHIAFLALSHVLTVASGLQGQCHSNSAVEQTLGICFTFAHLVTAFSVIAVLEQVKWGTESGTHFHH